MWGLQIISIIIAETVVKVLLSQKRVENIRLGFHKDLCLLSVNMGYFLIVFLELQGYWVNQYSRYSFFSDSLNLLFDIGGVFVDCLPYVSAHGESILDCLLDALSNYVLSIVDISFLN